jgi:hypothetical protein
MDAPRTVWIGTVRLWHWILFVVFAAMAAGIGLIARASSSWPVGIVAILLGIAALLALVNALDKKPRIVLDNRGLWVRGLGTAPLPWEHVVACEEGELPNARGPGRRFLAIEIAESRRLEETVGPLPLERDGGKMRIVIGTEDVDIVNGELPKLVRAWIHAPGGARPAKPKAREVPPPAPPMPKIDEGPYRSANAEEDGTPFFPPPRDE